MRPSWDHNGRAGSSRLYFDAAAERTPHAAATSALLKQLDADTQWHGGVAERQRTWEELEQALARRLGFDGARFGSGGTHAAAMATEHFIDALRAPATAPSGRVVDQGPVVLMSTIEHPAVAENVRGFALDSGLRVVDLPASRSGVVDLKSLSAFESVPVVGLVLMAANNETGVVQPLEAIAAWCRSRDAKLLVDWSQALAFAGSQLASTLPLADVIFASSHKLGGMSGSGFVASRLGAICGRLTALGRGSLAAAQSTVSALEACDQGFMEAIRATRDALERILIHAVPGLHVVGADAPRLPGHLNVLVEGCAGDGVLAALDLKGIAVSTGSACASGAVEPSPVLVAMGFSEDEALQSIRWSIDRPLSEASLHATVQVFAQVIARARDQRARNA